MGKVAGCILVSAVILSAAFLGTKVVREGFRLEEAPIHSNWGTANMYQEIGIWLKNQVDYGTGINLNNCELGTITFYSERYILNDPLSDRRIIEKKVRESKKGGGLKKLLIRLNFAFLRNSEGYPEILYTLTGRILPKKKTFTSEESEHFMRWVISSKWNQRSKKPIEREVLLQGRFN